MRPFFDENPREWVNMGVTGENLAGEYFISTGSGKYMRNVTLDPEDCLGVVEINEAGDSYRALWKSATECPVVDRWNEYMADILELVMDPETGAQPKLEPVFRMD